MGVRSVLALGLLVCCVAAQNTIYRVCMPPSRQNVCNSMMLEDSRVRCELVETSIDCALKLSRGEADFGSFTEEEAVLLSQQLPGLTVIANIRHELRQEEFAFEVVAVVRSSHSGGLEGLLGGGLCHPGLDNKDQRWSPRVLRHLEERVARTDRCAEADLPGRTFEELEVASLSRFFGPSCRPGPWSLNSTLDQQLKLEFPNLCHLCNETGDSDNCDGYGYDMGLQIHGVDNQNRHIQALECLVRHGGNVSYVAWQHVREYFTERASGSVSEFALLCEDGTTRALSEEVLAGGAPCAWIRQPWRALLANTVQARPLQTELSEWWSGGASPEGSTWQTLLFHNLVGGSEFRVNFLTNMPSVQAYVGTARNMSDIDSISSCMAPARWCTVSAPEYSKCQWIRHAAFSLGLQPALSCRQRETLFLCLEDIRDHRADFISLDSNYGYLARTRFNLGSVMLVQNSMANSSRVAALVKEEEAVGGAITRFENLRGVRACFPEYGGIAFMAFVRAAHERGIVSESECDYSRAVGEFFSSSCAPGALDHDHSFFDSEFNMTVLCTSCRNVIPIQGPWSDFTCAADNSNLFYGTNGTIACLNDPDNNVAFVETQELQHYILSQQLSPASFRALCRNNSLALSAGADIDDDCLLALVVNEEVLTRRNDPQHNSLSSLLAVLEDHFGYNAAAMSRQLVNLQIFSSFDGASDLLFLDSALGFTEPSLLSNHVPARNYMELFRHLDACTADAPALAGKALFSLFTLFVMNVMIRFVL